MLAQLLQTPTKVSSKFVLPVHLCNKPSRPVYVTSWIHYDKICNKHSSDLESTSMTTLCLKRPDCSSQRSWLCHQPP